MCGVMLLFLGLNAEAKVRLPRLVSDGMVLQRDVPLKVWGWADAGEQVQVAFRGVELQTTTDGEGRWMVELPAQEAGGPFEMQVNEITLKDILVGDVWLCSGQSNMELQVVRVMDMYREEILSYENPMIRHFKVPTLYSFAGPQEDIPYGEWQACTQEQVMQFSALAYFFARRLYETTGVPVGLLNVSVGGSRVESWISEEGLKPYPQLYNTLGIHHSKEYVELIEKSDRMRSMLWHKRLNEVDEGLGKWQADKLDVSDWEQFDLFSREWAVGFNGRPVSDEEHPAVHRPITPINGSMWLRKEFDLGELQADEEATLRMGCMVDADSVFVNGQFVGWTSYQYPPRIYRLPAGLLREKGNTIAVRLISQGGVSHVVPDKPYKIVQGEKEISLLGDWYFKRGAVMPALRGEAFFRWEPTALHNAMLAPTFNYAIKGALWYQGESNTGNALLYAQTFKTLVEEWRAKYQHPTLPVISVQLPGFMEVYDYPTDGGWAQLREIQRRSVEEIPMTAMAVAIDCGEWNDIHPLNKRTIADRMVAAARALAYGEKVCYEGPSVERATANGNEVTIYFTKRGGKPVDMEDVKWCAVAGEDGRFVWADAKVERGRLVLKSEVENPVRVRYAWADNPEGAALKNKEGFPASPFEVELAR